MRNNPITESWGSGPVEPLYEICDECGHAMTDKETQDNTHPLLTLCRQCLDEWKADRTQEDEE